MPTRDAPTRRAPPRPHSMMQLGRADLVGDLARPRARTRGARSRCRRGARPGTAATCSGRKRWCTEQWPFHSRNVASLTSRSLEPAELEARVPHPHVVLGVAHRRSRCCGRGAGRGRTAPCRPGSSAHSSTARALDDVHTAPPCSPDERLQRGGRVHVGDRHDPVDVGDAGERLPRLLDLVDVGHVGHRAAGVEVGEDHLLVVAGEHVGRLGHEVHAAEHDVGRPRSLSAAKPGELERVAAGVGPADDLVALVVVAEDEEPVAERRPWPRRSSASSSSGVARV